MKIGVMLRHWGQPGGIGVYTNNILANLLQVDQKNQYVMLYYRQDYLGLFSAYSNVTEKVILAPNKLWWDQISVPRFAAKEGFDIIYNPKLSVPLLTQAKTVLVMHGAEQFAVPSAFPWYDRAYFSIANRLYCKKATAIISNTHLGVKDIVKYMGANPKKICPIHESYNEQCRVLDTVQLAQVKDKYSLPKYFLLFVGGISPLKNFGNILKGYKIIQGRFPHKLVAVGFKGWKFSKALELIDELGLRDHLIFTDFVPNEDIPAIYNLADVFVFPSLYEGFGMPVLEAMACACPVVATETGCTPEVTGDAALLVDPYNPMEIAAAIEKVLTDQTLKEQMIKKGLVRYKQFSWQKCAKETLALFESLCRPNL